MGPASWPMRRFRSPNAVSAPPCAATHGGCSPPSSSCSCRASSSTPRGGAFQGDTMLSAIPLAVLLPELFGSSPHAWFGPGRVVARLAAVFTGAPDPAVPRTLPADVLLLPGRLLQGVLDGPAACAVGEPRKRTVARHRSRSSCRTCIAISCMSRFSFSSCWRTMYGRRSGSDPATAEFCGGRLTVPVYPFGIGWVLCPHDQRWSCWAGIRWAAIRLRHVIGGYLDRLSRPPIRKRRTTARAVSTARTCGGPGAASSPSPSPTSTSGSARWASGQTGGSSDRLPDVRAMMSWSSRRRRGASGGRRGVPRRRLGGPVCKSLLGRRTR